MGCQNFRIDVADQRRPKKFQNGRNGRKTAEMAGKRPENRLKLPKSTIYAQVLQARGHMGCQNFRLDEADQRRPNFFSEWP